MHATVRYKRCLSTHQNEYERIFDPHPNSICEPVRHAHKSLTTSKCYLAHRNKHNARSHKIHLFRSRIDIQYSWFVFGHGIFPSFGVEPKKRRRRRQHKVVLRRESLCVCTSLLPRKIKQTTSQTVILCQVNHVICLRIYTMM